MQTHLHIDFMSFMLSLSYLQTVEAAMLTTETAHESELNSKTFGFKNKVVFLCFIMQM